MPEVGTNGPGPERAARRLLPPARRHKAADGLGACALCLVVFGGVRGAKMAAFSGTWSWGGWGVSAVPPAAKRWESLSPLDLPAPCGGGGSRSPCGGRALSAPYAAPRACPRCGPPLVCDSPRSRLKVDRPAGM